MKINIKHIDTIKIAPFIYFDITSEGLFISELLGDGLPNMIVYKVKLINNCDEIYFELNKTNIIYKEMNGVFYKKIKPITKDEINEIFKIKNIPNVRLLSISSMDVINEYFDKYY